MKKEVIYAIIFLLVLIVFLIGNIFFKHNRTAYYENYNRVIPEPDSIKIIGDDF